MDHSVSQRNLLNNKAKLLITQLKGLAVVELICSPLKSKNVNRTVERSQRIKRSPQNLFRVVFRISDEIDLGNLSKEWYLY